MSRSLRVRQECIDRVKLSVKRSGFFSQKELAEDVGLALATVSKFLTGRPVDRATFVELCEKLSLDYEAIVDRSVILDDEDQGIEKPSDRELIHESSAFSQNQGNWGEESNISPSSRRSEELTTRNDFSIPVHDRSTSNPTTEVRAGQAQSTQGNTTQSSYATGFTREEFSVTGEETVSATKITSIVIEQPEGQVPLNSIFYVERPPVEEDCYESIVRPGTLIRVKAPRQMGKSSLMSRVLDYAIQQGYQSIYLSFQSADARALKDLDLFLRWFCCSITHELNLANRLNDYWKDDFLGSKDKCTNYLQRYVLLEAKSPIALGLDEVDEIFKHEEVATDFFGLLRAWHERAKNNALWQKLRLVITHSKEVYIPLDINQSPFNVGSPIELRVLTPPQVHDLVRRHGLNWDEEQLEQLTMLLGGHPYLVRMALYQIARGRMTLEQLKRVAPTEEGPYSDHLRRHLLNLQETKDRNLLAAVRQVMSCGDPVDVGPTEAFKLCSMGLVKLRGNEVVPLCDLYRQYFCDRLGVMA